MIRRLGKRWQQLHSLIYVSAVLGVVHYWWLVKKDVQKPQIYAVIIGTLLLARVILWARKRAAQPGLRAPRPEPATGD